MGNKVEGNSNPQDSTDNSNPDNKNNQTGLNEEQIQKQRLAYLERKIAESSNNNNSSKMEIEIPENLKKDIIINTKSVTSNNPVQYNNNNISNSNINNNNSSDRSKLNKVEVKQQIVNETKPQPQKNIDFEHVAIEKIFKITIEKEKADKLMYLENYSKGLIGLGKENKFRVNDLDNLIITLIDLEKNNIVDFFLTSFHRAYELIEVKFKKELLEKFSDTLKLLASYFAMVLTYPENFDITLVYEKVEEKLAKYINDTVDSNEDEVLKFFTLCFVSTEDNEESMKCVFNYIVNIINRQNIKCFLENKSNVRKFFLIFLNLFFI
jgi:hypothetical protein